LGGGRGKTRALALDNPQCYIVTKRRRSGSDRPLPQGFRMSTHHHDHHHHHPGQGHPPASIMPSILRMSVLERLAVAAAAIALIWGATLWAMA
jgi:hypothetical protein